MKDFYFVLINYQGPFTEEEWQLPQLPQILVTSLEYLQDESPVVVSIFTQKTPSFPKSLVKPAQDASYFAYPKGDGEYGAA